MLTHPRDPERRLVELADLADGTPLPAGVLGSGHAGVLGTIVGWARDYLCRPHPDLGRRGPVCPYARAALDRKMLYLAVCPGDGTDRDRVLATVRGYREWFEEFGEHGELGEPGPLRQPHLLTFLILFPDVAPARAAEVIEGAQRRLKAEHVDRGLMIGEFHDGPPAAPGLWNTEFRPLRSPVPLLAIRRMVPSDLPFLRHDPRLVAAYQAQFA